MQMLMLPPHCDMAVKTAAHAPITLLLPVLSAVLLLLPLASCSISHIALQLPAASMTSAHTGAELRRMSHKINAVVARG